MPPEDKGGFLSISAFIATESSVGDVSILLSSSTPLPVVPVDVVLVLVAVEPGPVAIVALATLAALAALAAASGAIGADVNAAVDVLTEADDDSATLFDDMGNSKSFPLNMVAGSNPKYSAFSSNSIFW